MSEIEKNNEAFKALSLVSRRIAELENKNDQLKAENDKLRELVRRFCEYVSQDRCEGCVWKSRCNEGLVDECWHRSDIRTLASELGIEVPNE